MDVFACQSCGQRVYFENRRCGRCGHDLAFLSGPLTLSATEPEGNGTLRALAAPGALFRPCANAASDACNWLVPAGSAEAFCAACRHNRTIPDLSAPGNLRRWRVLEGAKHRLIYTLLKLRLPLRNRADWPGRGLAFDFLDDMPGQRVLTGQEDGVVTLAVREADDDRREEMRVRMGEPYRTVLGHFRHEVGHHYWDVLVRDRGHLAECRRLFGDERADYDEALARHYRDGAPPDWAARHISAYSTAHPWEDFAETWANYLHVVDTLHTARAFALDLRPREGTPPPPVPDPHEAGDAEAILDSWVPLTFALNSLSRSMGQADLYPFVLAPAVREKMGLIHRLVHARG